MLVVGCRWPLAAPKAATPTRALAWLNLFVVVGTIVFVRACVVRCDTLQLQPTCWF